MFDILDWNLTDLGQIDPTKLTQPAEHTRVLKRFLIQNKADKKFYKNTPYEIIINGNLYQFTLTHDILHRMSESKPDQDRFDVLEDSKVGKGAFGSFYKIAGTLLPELNGKLIFKNKHRGVKTEARKNIASKKIADEKIRDTYFENYSSLAAIMELNTNRHSRFYKLIKAMHDGVKSVLIKDASIQTKDESAINRFIITNKHNANLSIDMLTNMHNANQSLETRLNNLDGVYQDQNQNHKLKDVVKQLMVNDELGISDEVLLLRKHIKFAVISYLDSTYTKSSIEKSDRAASQQRLEDMCNILNAANDGNFSDNPEALIKEVNAQLKKVKRGIFQTNHRFFRKFGSSALVENVKSAIKTYRATTKSNRPAA